jgi:K+-transporting ATPase c subunit
MALTKETVVDKIEVLEKGQVQIRTATRVLEDGVELSSSFHRHLVMPSTKASGSWADTDISGEDARVQAIATATWTSSVKTAYQEMVDAQSI